MAIISVQIHRTMHSVCLLLHLILIRIYIYYFFFVAFAFGARQGEKLLLLWARDIGRGLNFVGNPLHTGALLLQCVLCAQWLLPPSLLQNLIQFLCSFRLRWCVCSGECIYLMKTLSLPLYLPHSLRAIFLAAGNSTKPTANATSNTITVRANRLVSKTNRNKGKIALRSGVQPALELTTSIEHRAGILSQSNKCVQLNCGKVLSTDYGAVKSIIQ